MARLSYAHWCLVLQGVSKHVGYLLLLASQLCLMWTLALWIRSDLEIPLEAFLMSPTFSEEAPKWSENVLNKFRAIWRLFCPIRHARVLHSCRRLWYPWWSPLLVLSSIIQPSDRSFGGASSGLLIVPKFSLILRVFWSYRKDCFAIATNVPGSLIPEFLCSCLETKNILSGFFPTLWQDFSCSRLSSFSVRRGGKK